MELSTPIEYLKGIGPERAKLIKNVLDLHKVEDFLTFYPIRYIDKSKLYKVGELREINNEIPLKGRITDIQEVAYAKGRRMVAKFRDETGTMELVWFKYSKWLKEQIPLNTEVIIFGRVQIFNNVFSMPHPEIEKNENKENSPTLLPVYSSSEKLTKRGINNRFFQQILLDIVLNVPTFIDENLPSGLMKGLKLISRVDAYQNIHFPKNNQWQKAADRRLKFEEAFFFQLGYGLKKKHNKTSSLGNPFPLVGDYFTGFYENNLPFELTNAQKRVLKEIRNDMKLPVQMNRLLQGDVGSGKTMVALLSMLIALDNGFQSCLMAPTEILAQQHFNGISDLLYGTGIEVKLLTGSTKASERKVIHEMLENGTLPIIVGTHALLEDKVKFKKLGLAIIDEQHRFGVAQRAKLWAKNVIPPHILVMTATPIPRTLAMSFYSDLDVSVIDEMPVGRKPIVTAHRKEKDRLFVFNFAKEEITKGRQIYFVYPLIEESETLDYKNLNEGFDTVKEFFPVPDYDVVMLHGKMKPDEKDAAMQYFASGKAQIMVATTVIEVGVNVPNASVMIIESAERFGLSQLHQLRGRVGRGAEQSYCILMTSDKMTQESRKRIKTMVETNDGFKISEVDMELRGPGDILGTQQSGVIDFKKLDLMQDSNIIKAAKECVEKLLEIDPLLAFQEHQGMKSYYVRQYKGKNKWAKIS
ncbi:ATP-dependent DNA helicase RecG [Elizabethkingia anophelis]|uniref:ATP-dependent DNA helicase RecG n=1 Tax=Elizabethkingia anophelis TaxID=1117645 RepID=UPI00063AAC7A|nr:ATP-dependent DNA helicase RecG [Elizabethkingia anophelis]AKH93344.1 ATP-dependent DNA helicase RecG [Elizabethkingia anophelis FMS-007]MCT3662985.1 ATP-dependent DNA helicase RecG [Elizabethkingia anophelis]MCT3800161.1 ATP-dependent DNA helicase RecG [Elizabethkingia anophelis]MCT3904762.1 ATP-dependent DNA helicase RecG [Elizabethkingia anophelis]MCT4057400.1 ATP-dependent DNA helicase RecG [Elizabethkingia anophelis]